IYEDFMAAMDKIEDDPETGEFPKGAEVALTYFNKMVDAEKKEKKEVVKEEAPVKAEKATKSKAAKSEKAEKEKSKKTEKKEAADKNKYGHREGSQAALIDTAFEKGGSFEKIAENLKLTVSRIKSHYHHMTVEKKVKFIEKGDTVKIEK
ncbi:MAG TPA: hypothetical protein PK941_11255, partial [Paludibacter sp.]|nr:hypothetical protein [Paludibacter sp.]